MFELNWTESAVTTFNELADAALTAERNRAAKGKKKASKQEGLFKQVRKSIILLKENPKHPGLKTHPYSSLTHPWSKDDKVFEAYAQNKTPGAYRIFWCYGPGKQELTVIAITPHP